MAAIPCPQCKRLLNLPDDREIETVSCPMCGHAFAPPATPKIVSGSVPMPTVRIPLQFVPDDPALPSMPMKGIEGIKEDEDRPPFPDKDDDQRAMESAARCLKTMAFLGLGHTMPCCGCLGYILHDHGSFGVGGIENFVAFLCISVIAYAFILLGARALRLQSSYAWAFTGVAVGLLFAAGLILLNVPLVLSFLGVWNGPVPILGQPCTGVLIFVPSLLVIVFGAIGGVKGLLVLMKPDIRELYFLQEPRTK